MMRLVTSSPAKLTVAGSNNPANGDFGWTNEAKGVARENPKGHNIKTRPVAKVYCNWSQKPYK